MNLFHIAIQSLKHYLRNDITIALGVAAATAVLTGALIVGDSMRQSLRGLTLDRLGQIDEMLISDGFFRAKLADELKLTTTYKEHYDQAVPAILFPGGTVEFKPEKIAKRAGQVAVLGITPEFWSLENQKLAPSIPTELTGYEVLINQTLADDLGIDQSDVTSEKAIITVRIPKQMQLPADSALGRKTDLIESLVDLKVVGILPAEGLGRFSLHPSQSDPMNVYVPIELLQEALAQTVLEHKSDPAQANTILISSKSNTPPEQDVTTALRNGLRPTLEDYGIGIKRVKQVFGEGEQAKTIFDYWSLSSEKMVLEDEVTSSIEWLIESKQSDYLMDQAPYAEPIFTYLANDIRPSDKESGIPFSMVTAVNFGESFHPTSASTSEPIKKIGDNEIVLNEWAAEDIGAKVGDKIILTYFEPETTHGSQAEGSAEFTLVDIAKITLPDKPYVVPRRGPIEFPVFSSAPTVSNDPDMTPEVPGVTDAASIENWDLPFQTADKLRPQDEDYWDFYRTTPKAFISLAAGQKLWDSRFGKTTSIRLMNVGESKPDIETMVLNQIASDKLKLGMHLVPIKRRGLAASSGSTPFDVLFLALSMFVIGSALILVSLLFRLALQQRSAEAGLLKATGFPQKQIRKLWLNEMMFVCLIGAVLGIFLGIGYAWLMIKGLTTWWVGAISRPFLVMHVSPLSLIIGLVSGLLICIVTIGWSLRRMKKLAVRDLLGGKLEAETSANESKPKRGWIPSVLIVLGIGLAGMATQLAGEAQAGSFMGAGFLVLVAFLMLVYAWLKRPTGEKHQLDLSRLALMSAKRNPLRSTLTIGLVAVASFLIAAVSAFRLAPSERGTAGFDWIAQSSQPVFGDLSTKEGQEEALGVGNTLSLGTDVVSIRFKPGEDASCNNLYQSTQPRALGVPESFVTRFDQSDVSKFGWGTHIGGDDRVSTNPWHLLENDVHAGTKDDPIPVIIDKNTANYSLKIYFTGTVREVQYDTGETFHFVAVGFLENTILQGSLIMSEADFESAFPSTSGYQYFLIDEGKAASNEGDATLSSDVAMMEDRLGDQGFDARSADKLLANFMSVQNTYLSTFQTLGALGLLLGTFGLAAVQVRSVLERTKELGLMRAVGFAKRKLSWMVLLENAWLLFLGLAVGIGAAMFTTIPHWLVGSATVPWATLGIMFAGIIIVGLVAAWLASRNIARLPLLESLRA